MCSVNSVVCCLLLRLFDMVVLLVVLLWFDGLVCDLVSVWVFSGFLEFGVLLI